jgi:hypothetical protein
MSWPKVKEGRPNKEPMGILPISIPFFTISATNGLEILKSEKVNGWGSINNSSFAGPNLPK